MENDRLLADGSFSSQDYVSATNIEEPKGSEMSARSVKKTQEWVENDRLLADESLSAQDLCECNEHRGTERFRDEREERKKKRSAGWEMIGCMQTNRFASQTYVSATNIPGTKGSEMSARSGRTADRRTYNE